MEVVSRLRTSLRGRSNEIIIDFFFFDDPLGASAGSSNYAFAIKWSGGKEQESIYVINTTYSCKSPSWAAISPTSCKLERNCTFNSHLDSKKKPFFIACIWY